jgi:hypothetical protein
MACYRVNFTLLIGILSSFQYCNLKFYNLTKTKIVFKYLRNLLLNVQYGVCVCVCVCVCIIPSFHTLVRDLGGLWRRDAPSAQTLACTMATVFCRCGSSKHNNDKARRNGSPLH